MLVPTAVIVLMGIVELASGLTSSAPDDPGGQRDVATLLPIGDDEPPAGQNTTAQPEPERVPEAENRPEPAATRAPPQGAINPSVPGITTFRGNLTRTYYGEGPVPRRPEILWRYPAERRPLLAFDRRERDEELVRRGLDRSAQRHPGAARPAGAALRRLRLQLPLPERAHRRTTP